ncbi:polyprotein [Gossypium australe]|uniref:Polyprotein n=1 Tax=Gossypium australe TaxID=47621 RepID=A0A5B6WZ45_9ROSI|nr:polyprotein [Gossypium australe]
MFVKILYEHGLYIKKNRDDDIRIMCLYVDDMIFTGNNPEFKMENIGEMSYSFGIEKYAKKFLNKFKMKYCKSVATSVEPDMK